MRKRVLVLGGSFAGVATARNIKKYCGDRVDITLIDTRPYLVFIPNILPEILVGHDPEETLLMPTVGILEKDGIRFIQARVDGIDLGEGRVRYTPSVRPGASGERTGYDYLVIALGARLAFEDIPGFNEYGHSISDTHYGNKLRIYIEGGLYRGGGIAIGSTRFHSGAGSGQDNMPEVMSACEYPLVETAFALGAWLEDRGIARPAEITLFTPGKGLLSEAGVHVSDEVTRHAVKAGFRIMNGAGDIKRLRSWGIEFENGSDIEAALKIVLPDWAGHDILKGLSITDDAGFVVTDRSMRCKGMPNVFAAGDCAALTVPKLGELGDAQSKVVAGGIADDLGIAGAGHGAEFKPEIIFVGDMGRSRGFFIHSDIFYGGSTSVFKTGYSYYSMKLGFKEVFFRSGARPPSWGVPLAELVAERFNR
jgi:sulfide:quinone oxidoreductase